MIFRVVHTVFFYIITIVSFLVGTTVIIPLVFFSRSKHKSFQFSAHLWARFLSFFSGVKVKVSGRENLPKNTTVIYAANHQGMADILIVLACLPAGFRFAVKSELFKVPLFGWYLKRAGYFSIDRKLILSAYRTVETIVEIIKAGESVLIFPEGTRSKTGELGRFKRGSLLAALKSGATIIPIAISGSFNILPRGSWLINPTPVKLSVGQPIRIETEADYDTKVAEVREAIEQML